MPKDTSLNVLRINNFNYSSGDFYINSIKSHLKESHLHINKPHKHDFFAVFLFTQGTGHHEIDFNSYMVKPNTIFILSPGQTHNWKLSEECEGVVIFHSKEFYEAHYIRDQLSEYTFFSHIQNQTAVYLEKDPQLEIVSLFHRLLRLDAQEVIKKKQLILSILTQLYIELENILFSTANAEIHINNNYYSNCLKFQFLVEQNFTIEKSVEKYASWMNITFKHLNRINRVILNKTTSEIINDRVILEAKRILIYGKKNISEVADELGFLELAHFSKIFKNKTGMTPSDFLKVYK